MDGTADVVISDGVIHHTDDPFVSFSENCRILKPGGRMYLAVYKPTGRYPWLYKYPGAVIRFGLQHAGRGLWLFYLLRCRISCSILPMRRESERGPMQ